MGAPTRHDLKTHWRFSVPQLAYITLCGCANCLAIGRAEDSRSRHTHTHTQKLLRCGVFECICVCVCQRKDSRSQCVSVWWSGGACLAEYSRICLFSAQQPRHQISPSSSLRCLMTSPVCPLDFGPASSPVMSLPPGLHLKWHHFCCITISPSPSPACESRGSFSLSLATQRGRETPHYGNIRCASRKWKWADRKIHHCRHPPRRRVLHDLFMHPRNSRKIWALFRAREMTIGATQLLTWNIPGVRAKRGRVWETAIERGLTYIRRRLKYLWMWVS